MAAPALLKHGVYVQNTTLNSKWLALLKAAALTLRQENFAGNMVREGSVLLLGVMQLLLVEGSAASMGLKEFALSATAPQPSMQEEDVLSMAVAA